MYHCNGRAVGSGNHVDFLVKLRCLFGNYHCKYGCTCGNVTCTNSYGVSSCHTCTCITLGRSNLSACLKCTAYVKKLSALFCKVACALACVKHTGEKLLKCPGVILILDKICKNIKQIISVITLFAVNGEHTRCFTNAKHLISCKLPMDKACKSCKVSNILNVGHVLKDILIKMSDAPSLRDSRIECFCKSCSCYLCNGVSPCSEGGKKVVILVKCKVAVHHTGDTDSAKLGKLFAVLSFKILAHLGVAILKTADDIVHGVCPDAVNVAVFPCVSAGCDYVSFLVKQNCFNSCGAEFKAHCKILQIHSVPHYAILINFIISS